MLRPVASARHQVRTFDSFVDRSFDAVRGRPAVDRLFYAASEQQPDEAEVSELRGGVEEAVDPGPAPQGVEGAVDEG
ncbi:MAG TPA: hypothetical protein VG078_07965, partial [Acidimicrobiales bacterium]|nr:hypothetical protein [Acidimicrobiales bacterium]